jgi:hypothetical protein
MIKKSISQNRKQNISMVCGSNLEQGTLIATNWKSIWEITKIREFFLLDFVLKFYISSFNKLDFVLHALTRLKGLKHPTLGSIGQYGWTNCFPNLAWPK